MAGRPRQFDREAALIVAMEQFWRDGYEATTVSRLTAEMGITPPSLYAAFGDKDQLFDASASCYFDNVSAQAAKVLDRPTAREAITELMWSTAAAHTDTATPPGCFMLTEPRLADQRNLMRQQIAQRLERGVTDGDLPPQTSPGELATFIIAVMGGMSARARDGGTREDLGAIVKLALAVLPG
ncbi:TetR family transcriptional regulator [Glaciihabitans tibetensis]|uniref:TetR family transcriptional regulator n=1 Tax=Glaciihabitans tibetensis TaxID=1266600 RepID=A0A2T0VA46_9MICO|nr:TetR/AcrR family transcriptional regulator [Glaciihabitans tibetensis]PRY67065.1 TetR family transcriptional regulator [Glaciihabitans tibetensis]